MLSYIMGIIVFLIRDYLSIRMFCQVYGIWRLTYTLAKGFCFLSILETCVKTLLLIVLCSADGSPLALWLPWNPGGAPSWKGRAQPHTAAATTVRMIVGSSYQLLVDMYYMYVFRTTSQPQGQHEEYTIYLLRAITEKIKWHRAAGQSNLLLASNTSQQPKRVFSFFCVFCLFYRHVVAVAMVTARVPCNTEGRCFFFSEPFFLSRGGTRAHTPHGKKAVAYY